MDVIFWSAKSAVAKAGGEKPLYGQGEHFFTRYLGPYKVAHWLRKHGYLCQVIDCIADWSHDQLYTITKKFITNNTKALCISTTFLCGITYQWPDGSWKRFPKHVVDVIKLIKSEYPKIKIILGGYISEQVAFWGLADATVMSYTEFSEDILLEYLDHFTKGTELPIGKLVFNYIGGVAKPRMWYSSARNPKYSIETDDFRFLPQDAILDNEPLPLDVSKGCIFKCRFCQYAHIGKKKLDYIRSMSLIKDELIHNYNNFGTTTYILIDDTFNDTEEKIKRFHKMTEELPFKIKFIAFTRADLLERYPDTPYLLKESGLWGTYHGLESLHPYASKLIGKGWSGTNAKSYIPKLYHEIWNKEVNQFTNFIAGLPKETEQDLRNTLKWCVDNELWGYGFSRLQLNDPRSMSSFSIFSEFERNSEKYGFKFPTLPLETNGTLSGWSNETWTEDSAAKIAAELTTESNLTKKIHVWRLPSLVFLGLTDKYVSTTPVSQYNWKLIDKLNIDTHTAYYNKLLNL